MRSVLYKILNLFTSLSNSIYRKKLRVLAFHDIKNVTLFEAQINYLKSNYSIITIGDLRKHIYGKKPLPNFPLLLTFDDGDISVLEKGLPVLKKYNCPICLFIITSLINTNIDFWWDVVYKNGYKNNEDVIKTKEKINMLKSVPNKERLKMMDNYMVTSKKQLSLKHLKILRNNNVYIGNHSHTHPMFDKCDNEEILNELKNAKGFFDENSLEGYDVFAYPNGNFDINSEKILIEKDVNLCFLFNHKINPTKINPLRISRIRANSDMTISELKSKVSGLHSLILNFKSGFKLSINENTYFN